MKERATWRIWIVLIVAFAVQTTWLAPLRPLGTWIDVGLLTTVSIALLLGFQVGAIYGLAAGLLTGYGTAFNVGSFIVSRAVVGAVFGSFETRFSGDNPLAPPICAACAVVLANLVFALMSPTTFPFDWWWQQTLRGVVVHSLLIVPLHPLLARLLLPPTRSMFA